jgi:hypothetical protein
MRYVSAINEHRANDICKTSKNTVENVYVTVEYLLHSCFILSGQSAFRAGLRKWGAMGTQNSQPPPTPNTPALQQ